MIVSFLLFLGVQILPLLLGYRLKILGYAQERWGRPLSRFIIIVMNTAVCLLATWRLEIHWHDLGLLLLIALLFGLILTGVGELMSRFHSHDRPSQGGYIMATSISNFGFTMAGFVCLLIGGQDALSIQTVYIWPLVLLIYLFWFPLARFYGATDEKIGLLRASRLAFSDLTSLPMFATMAGAALHANRVPFPDFMAHVLNIFVYSGTLLSMFCIGITLQLKSIGDYTPQNLTVAVSKFLIAPLIGLALALACGIHGLNLQVVIICSSVPVGLFSSFAASIFGLNRNLTNSLFIVNTTVYLLVVLPLLFWLLPHFIPVPSVELLQP